MLFIGFETHFDKTDHCISSYPMPSQWLNSEFVCCLPWYYVDMRSSFIRISLNSILSFDSIIDSFTSVFHLSIFEIHYESVFKLVGVCRAFSITSLTNIPNHTILDIQVSYRNVTIVIVQFLWRRQCWMFSNNFQ